MILMLIFVMLSIYVNLSTEDVIIWTDNINGNYTIKCGYMWLLNNKQNATILVLEVPRRKKNTKFLF